MTTTPAAEGALYAANLDAIRAAQRRIDAFIRRTPVLTSATLDAMSGRRLWFKCELFQRTGSFKFRGATNAVRMLDDAAAARGVVTHSSGNHAQALALAAKMRGIPAHVVMPSNSAEIKKAAVRDYGGTIIECEPTLEAREATAARVIAEPALDMDRVNAEAWAIASMISTPGMIGLSGKWPVKCGSLKVTFFSAWMLFCGSSPSTRPAKNW